MTGRIHKCRKQHPSSWLIGTTLILLLSACGGGTPATDVSDASMPVTQKGFGPSQLYQPDVNPSGRVLHEGDIGIVFVGQDPHATFSLGADQRQQQVWFEIASDHDYAFELEEEDLALLARVDIIDSSGRTLLSLDTLQRFGNVILSPGRYVLNLVVNPTSTGTAPLFIRFDGDAIQASQPAQATYSAKALDDAVAEASQPIQITVDAFYPYQTWRPNPDHRNQLLSLKSCAGCDLRWVKLNGGMDLSGADLRNARLDNALLGRVNFSGADLSEASVTGAYMIGTNLSKANLSRADFSRSDLQSANFNGATAFKVDFSGANLYGTKFVGANVTDALFLSVGMGHSDFRNAILGGTFFRKSDASFMNLYGATLVQVEMRETVLDGSTWIDGRICAKGSFDYCR